MILNQYPYIFQMILIFLHPIFLTFILRIFFLLFFSLFIIFSYIFLFFFFFPLLFLSFFLPSTSHLKKIECATNIIISQNSKLYVWVYKTNVMLNLIANLEVHVVYLIWMQNLSSKTSI